MNSDVIKIDWLEVSLLKDKSEMTVGNALLDLLECFHLSQYFYLFERVGSNYAYTDIYRYQNININIPSEERFSGSAVSGMRRGIAISFSGSGLAYYQSCLLCKPFTLHSVCCGFLALVKKGYKVKCNRIDIACDDKCFGEDKPCLDLDIIQKYLMSGAFVSKFRKAEPVRESGEFVSAFLVDPKGIDQSLPYQIYDSADLSKQIFGRTIYLGKRTSNSFVRIYDKKAEQLVHGVELPSELTSWIRFEVEFKKSMAMSLFTNYCICETDEDFSRFFSTVIFNLIRFVDLDRSRKYNCSVADWWLEFVGCVCDKSLYLNKLEQNRYTKAVKHFSRNAAIVLGVLSCNPGLFDKILGDTAMQNKKSYGAICRDFKAFTRLSEAEKELCIEQSYREQSGTDYLSMFIDPATVDMSNFLDLMSSRSVCR